MRWLLDGFFVCRPRGGKGGMGTGEEGQGEREQGGQEGGQTGQGVG